MPLPLPGSPGTSWAGFRDRFKALFNDADPRVCTAFWFFGLINNVLYVIILSAALDLVGSGIPKGIVLLADVVPSFACKLTAPYFIHLVPYPVRVIIFVTLSVLGMLIIALTSTTTDGGAISTKLAGIVLASLSSGGGELSFLGLTHYYGPFSLASWSSGTGAAGLVGAGAYALATTSLGLSVKSTILASACLPAVMLVNFFMVLPLEPIRYISRVQSEYQPIADMDDVENADQAAGPRDDGTSKATGNSGGPSGWALLMSKLERSKGLFIPFMLPLLLVYVAEYTINQGVAPTLLFPLDETPFEQFRAFYPAYNAIYQIGVFISRSSTPFFRVHNLYLPSFLQVINLTLLTLHALFNFIPNVYFIFLVVFWEGLLGGLVYVNTFAEIGDRVPPEDREFSLSATTVSDSGGICIAGFLGMAMEVWLYHVLGRPSTQFRKIQVFSVVLFWSVYLFKGNHHGPPGLRAISSKLSARLTPWQTMVVTLLWLYISRNFAKIMGFESPEPLANLYSRSYFRATWVTTALDAGFWTAMKIRPVWLKDIASMVFTAYYLIAAEQADEKVRRVRATLTVEHLRNSWNKATTPYLSLLNALIRPRFMRYPPREIRIPRPRGSSYREPVNAWLYFDGTLAELREQNQLVLDVPGGGFVAMSPRTADDKLLAWAGKTRVPVLSVDYKKAPEYPYPYALNECYDVYQSIVQSRGRCAGLSGKSRPRIIVSGDSAGGNLATGMTIMILQSGRTETRRWQGESPLPPPDGLVLVYPSLDMNIGSWMTEEQMSLIQDRGMRKTNENILRRKSEDYNRLTPSSSHTEETLFPDQSKTNEPDLSSQIATVAENNQPTQIKTRIAVSSMISYFGDRILTPEMMRAMIILYVGPHNRPDFKTDFLLSPILAPDSILANFPKTYFLTGERDPLVDDTVIFAGRLRQAKLHRFRERQDLGLEKSRLEFNEKDHVEVNLVPAISHGFLNFPGLFPEAWRHINKCAKWIVELLDQAAERELKASTSSLAESMSQDLSRSEQYTMVLSSNNHHHESRRGSTTGESSAEEDHPLEMGGAKLMPMTKAKLSSGSLKQASKKGNTHDANNKKLLHQSSDSHGNTNTNTNNAFSFPLTLPKLKTATSSSSPALAEHMMITSSVTDNGSTITRLPSEEDLIGRRMNGLAGGLMGLGEGVRTP
ncbi:hypothetical protein PISL3812_05965 [Talaromyces islandicus]|uniref:Alpha/beta hydrolase fold-3 domain-containing protein n=1 Tax=Talaromyces islandicus TaxID=28573 RepID=A0A0U1M1K6_TALIS|nr:hypothetical protein PISL3812_05965 [Talaromyces islandicus]